MRQARLRARYERDIGAAHHRDGATGHQGSKKLADGAVRFLAANYRYERKCQQGLSGTAVAPAALPETTSADSGEGLAAP